MSRSSAPGNQPVAEGLPLSSPAGTPTSSDDHKRDMLPTGAAAHLVRIAAETASRRTELVRQSLHDLARRGLSVGGDEAKEAQGEQLYAEAEAVSACRRGAERTSPAGVVEREGEVGDEVGPGDLGWPSGEALQLVVGKGPTGQIGSVPCRLSTRPGQLLMQRPCRPRRAGCNAAWCRGVGDRLSRPP